MSEGIFSLDVSAASTGWCYTLDGFNFIEGLIQTNSKLNRSARLEDFANKLRKLLREYKPKYVVQEDTFSGINTKTLKILSEFAGVSKLICMEILSIDPYIISNATVKSYFTSSTKEDLFNFTCELFDLNNLTFKKDNDIIDAKAQLLCYADTVLNKYKYRFDKIFGYVYMEDYGE